MWSLESHYHRTTEGTGRGDLVQLPASNPFLAGLSEQSLGPWLQRSCSLSLQPCSCACLSDGEKQSLQCLAARECPNLAFSLGASLKNLLQSLSWKKTNNLLPNEVCLKEDELHVLLTVSPILFSFCHSFLPPVMKQEVWYKEQTKSKQQAQPQTGCSL